LKNGELPEVSWIVPNTFNSEHPPYDVTVGMWYVTTLINRVMQSKFWNDCAIILVWRAGYVFNSVTTFAGILHPGKASLFATICINAAAFEPPSLFQSTPRSAA